MTKDINCRRELFKAIALLLSINTNKLFTQKLIRDTYKQWLESSFTSNMCFGEFLQKMYGATEDPIKISKVH